MRVSTNSNVFLSKLPYTSDWRVPRCRPKLHLICLFLFIFIDCEPQSRSRQLAAFAELALKRHTFCSVLFAFGLTALKFSALPPSRHPIPLAFAKRREVREKLRRRLSARRRTQAIRERKAAARHHARRPSPVRRHVEHVEEAPGGVNTEARVNTTPELPNQGPVTLGRPRPARRQGFNIQCDIDAKRIASPRFGKPSLSALDVAIRDMPNEGGKGVAGAATLIEYNAVEAACVLIAPRFHPKLEVVEEFAGGPREPPVIALGFRAPPESNARIERPPVCLQDEGGRLINRGRLREVQMNAARAALRTRRAKSLTPISGRRGRDRCGTQCARPVLSDQWQLVSGRQGEPKPNLGLGHD